MIDEHPKAAHPVLTDAEAEMTVLQMGNAKGMFDLHVSATFKHPQVQAKFVEAIIADHVRMVSIWQKPEGDLMRVYLVTAAGQARLRKLQGIKPN